MEFTAPEIDLRIIMPVFIVMGWGVLLLIVDLFLAPEKRRWLPWIAAVGLVPAFIMTLQLWGSDGGTFTPSNRPPMVLADDFAIFLTATLLITGFLSILLSATYLRRMGLEKAEYYMLLLFSISGMILMAMANDLILVFLALELLSIPLYILAAFAWPDIKSEEAGLKYFLLGAFSSAFLVFGIALVYGSTGSTALPVIVENIGQGGTILLFGVAMLLVGFGFKVSAVPFHMWTPDVYQGSPTAVTGFMSVGAKVAGFAAMLRVFTAALNQLGDAWVPAVAVMAALTMIAGTVIALAQPNIKRMLAYSSISHAGYILMGVAAGATTPTGVSAALFYLLAYTFTNLGAFAVVATLEQREGRGLELDDYRGLAKRSPALALAMAYFMLSLTGVPPTGGFTGKFVIFGSSLEAGLTWLTLIGVITSVVSGYFYLRVVYMMYMYDGEEGKVETATPMRWVVGIAALATLLLGILPAYWLGLAEQAVFASSQFFSGG